MKTLQTITTKEQLLEHLNEVYSGEEIEEIRFRFVGYDTRCDWNTFLVEMRFNGNEQFYVAGMSDGTISI